MSLASVRGRRLRLELWLLEFCTGLLEAAWEARVDATFCLCLGDCAWWHEHLLENQDSEDADDGDDGDDEGGDDDGDDGDDDRDIGDGHGDGDDDDGGDDADNDDDDDDDDDDAGGGGGDDDAVFGCCYVRSL